jgi:hypothetical protein
MTHFESVYKETINGFEIDLSVTPENQAPDWYFENDEQRDELYEKIDNGDLLWFVARVTASKNGIVLGTAYLGGCCYESINDFINEGGYWDDLVAEATTEAQAKIKLLTEVTA